MALLITKNASIVICVKSNKNTFIFIVIQQRVIECVIEFMVQKNFAYVQQHKELPFL